MTTDRIEKQVVLRASRQRVWDALADSRQFGEWFGMELDGPFVAGQEITGRIVPTTVDAEVAGHQEPYRNMPVAFVIDRIEPMSLFSFRWHPFAIEQGVDYSHEPMTLVQFALSEAAEGTLLTITESGFDALPPERRAAAFKADESGWSAQANLIAKYLAKHA